MWLPVSTVAALFVLFDVSDGNAADKELDLIFKDRSQSEWREAWHRERYSRCKEKLLSHLIWACDKDIYRITRRSQPDEDTTSHRDIDALVFPWISEIRAHRMVRTRRGSNRRSGSSITQECCNNSCTWEEYAEYCPTNKRYTTYV